MQPDKYFEVLKPDSQKVPVLFNSPHSGRNYAPEFISSSDLPQHQLRSSEDFQIDALFAHVPAQGATLIKALFPRAWLDVNREPYELDPTMFDGQLPANINSNSPRVKCGLGTIARIVSENAEIYREPLSVQEGISRIENVYFPYHTALRTQLTHMLTQHGYTILIDCHSMPSCQPTSRLSRFSAPPASRIKADFVLGDRFGNSCSPFLINTAAHLLRGFGYHVAINKPYAGGFITEHYGRVPLGLHALQIEINRALYMDEKAIEKSPSFNSLAGDLEHFTRELIAITCGQAASEFIPSTALAAE